MSKLLMPFSILSQATGINALQRITDHFGKKNIIYFQTSELMVRNPELAPLHIDGDPVDTAPELHVKVIRNAFKLLHP
jgi:diacylglycerol kinase family enzyme